ncbi:hypothetical protein MJ584_22950 [Klebsiella pneumoniae]|nr:hypothetical protein MJ584_22950 [Klebsiella pneumoniae]
MVNRWRKREAGDERGGDGTLFCRRLARLLEGELPTPRRANLLTLSRAEPLGVVAAIAWNSPIASEMQEGGPGDRRRKYGDPQAGGSHAASWHGTGEDL